jgi:alcohol dehydrogenase
VGLCALMTARVAGAARVIAVDMVPERLEMARKLGGEPVHLTEEDPRAAVKEATEGRGVDVAVEAVGNEKALDMAIRLARKSGTVSVVGVYAERAQVHMGLVWIKNITLVGGQANVMGHLDSVLPLMAAGRLDPTPLVTHHMKLADAQEAYDAYAAHQALKIVLSA